MKLNLFGLSGGKDSTALLGWALHESGYPRESLRFSFADTENEYEEVYDQIRKLSAIVERAGCYPVTWLASTSAIQGFRSNTKHADLSWGRNETYRIPGI